MLKDSLEFQLNEAGQMSGARWAALLKRTNTGWEFHATYKFTQQLARSLSDFLQQKTINDWIGSAVSAGQYQVRAAPEAVELGCRKVCIFPDPAAESPLLVGADDFSPDEQRLWRVFALCQGGQVQDPQTEIPVPAIAFSELGGIPFNLDQALERLLASIHQTIAFDGGWLAVRSGDVLEVMAQERNPASLGKRFPLEGNPLLQKISSTRTMILLRSSLPDWQHVPEVETLDPAAFWVGLPLVIGRRLIGMVAVWRRDPFQSNELDALGRLSVQAANLLDESIAFSNVTDHLRRLGLLNDFAITVSTALDLEQIAQRVFALVRRAFGTELINLFLLSSEGGMLHHYYEADGSVIQRSLPTGEYPALRSVHLGDVLRSEDLQLASEYVSVYQDVRSALVVPLKFRRQVIGSLGLESTAPSAFTIYDEHLLMVIASHLAGLIENGRLRQEAEARARNLSLIHEVVQQVIGATDVHQAAQTAAELMARNFEYEVAVVALNQGPDRIPVVEGLGGVSAEIIQRGLREMEIPGRGGILSQVAVTGQSVLANDVGQEPSYRPIPNWDAGSEMCVPLREGERILGVIDVESQKKNAFTHSDLLVLESLAGILASVISKAGQYQELQQTVQQLEMAREELQQRIAAQRITEARLIEAAKLAAVGEMAAGIAHELNNPLTSITGFSELVLEEIPKDSTSRPDLELILRESKRARDVVLRLLDFARQGETVRVQANVNDIVTDVLALVKHLLHTSGISLQTLFSPGLAWILVDRNQMKQVVINLVHNAMHAMPDGGNLIIKTGMRQHEGKEWVTIVVEDTGQGIPRENLSRIFEPFFTTKAKSGGTGLGLSVSYGIITDHGGFIDVESEVRKGSIFTVWLPVEVT